MASTSQIAKSLHSGSRRANRVLLTLFVAGTLVVGIPGVYFVFKDTPQAHSLAALVSQNTSKFLSGLPLIHQDKAASAGLTPRMTAAAAPPANPSCEVKIVDQAVASINQALEKDPANPSLHNRLGIIYAEMGVMPEAEGQFKQAILLSRSKLAGVYAAIEKKKNEGLINEASTLMIEVSALQLELSSAHSNLARVFEKLGDNQRVVKQLEELNRDVTIGGGLAKTADSAGKLAPKLRPEIVAGLARAEALMQVGRMQDAGRELRTLLAVAPDLAEAHELLGRTGMATGNFFLAQRELEIAARQSPQKASIFANLGLVYQYRGKPKDAIQAFSRALQLDGKDSASAFNLGNIYASAGKNQEAKKCFQQAIAINPNMAVAHNNLASMYSQSGDYEGAIRQFEQAIFLAPQMASAHYGMGLAMYQMKDFAGASAAFKQAIMLNPNLIDARNKLEICLKKGGSGPSMATM